MAQHARLSEDGVVLEVASDAALATHAPALVAAFTSCPDDVQAGWTHSSSGQWAAPAAIAYPGVPAATTSNIPAPAFFMRFSPQEEAAIRASSDPVVQVFLRRIDDPRALTVDVSLPAVAQGVDYLTTTTPALLAQDRVAQILAPQAA